MFEVDVLDVVVAADEAFLRIHEVDHRVIAPVGEKRVGTSMKYDDKAGCTVMVSMELLSSQLLPPFIIFKGVFCATLMKKCSHMKKQRFNLR